MKTLVLKYDYGYDVFAFDETKEEIMTLSKSHKLPKQNVQSAF